MRKVLVFIILIGGLVVGGIYFINSQLTVSDNISASVQSDRFFSADDISWYQDPNQQFNLAIFSKPLVLTFTSENAQTLKEQSYLAEYSLAVNGTYYRGSYVESEHAGLLQIRGQKFWELLPDKQLTHVVVYDEVADKLQFLPTSEIATSDYTDDKYTLFQSGPLLIKNGVIQGETIANSLNGSGRFLRTVLGVTNDGLKFVLITRVNYTLLDLANLILNFPVFANKQISVINLDGGNSTAMYSQELEQFNYRENSRLPVVIGVK